MVLNTGEMKSRRLQLARMSVEVELETGEVTKYSRHENGRGLVSPSAEVNLSAFVSSASYVESEAQIGAESWIGQGSWIDHGAIIGARVFIGANVHVGADAFVGNEARLGSNTHIGRGAFIADGAVIDHEIQVPDFADVSARPTARARSIPSGDQSTDLGLDRAGWRRIWCARRSLSTRPPVTPVTAGIS
jgi:carbonic anhydrase/acetyltransferase-like protein (isoleucine patch superfamily)